MFTPSQRSTIKQAPHWRAFQKFKYYITLVHSNSSQFLTHYLGTCFYTASLAVSLVCDVFKYSQSCEYNLVHAASQSTHTQRFNHLATKQTLANYKINPTVLSDFDLLSQLNAGLLIHVLLTRLAFAIVADGNSGPEGQMLRHSFHVVYKSNDFLTVEAAER